MLSVTLGVDSHRLLAAMRDRASVNNAAMNIVTIMYPYVDIGCLNMLNLVGEKFRTPTLNLFITFWISVFSHCCHIQRLAGGVGGK